MKKAVAYARYSSNNQREESIDAQLRAIEKYAKENKIQIVATYYDEAQTGKNDNRDNFQNMYSAILREHIAVDMVLVHKFNRFARNKYDSAIYKKRLKDKGVRVVSVTQLIDDTPEGAMLEGFLEIIDEYYSANLALEVVKGMRENALQAKATGGRAVFGLSVNEQGFYYPNENAHIVKWIFEEYANGTPKTEICRQLNEKGIKNQYGRTFNTRTLFDMFRNEKYIGNYVLTLQKEETIRLDGVITPIIDMDLWERAKKVRGMPTKAKYRERKRFYHLTGKTTCAICGMPISGAGAKKQKNGTVHSYYKCTGKSKHKNGCTNTSLNKEWFENKVLNAVKQAVFNDNAIKELSRQAYEVLQEEIKHPTTDIVAMQKELTSITNKQSKLTDLYLDGEIDKNILNTKNEELAKRQRYLEKEIKKNKLLTKSQSLKEKDLYNALQKYVTNLIDIKNCSDDEFMRAVFNTFVINVSVSLDTVDVAVGVDFSALGGDTVQVGGASLPLAPITIHQSFKRKSNLYGRYSDNN